MQASIATQRQDRIYLTASELPFAMLIRHGLRELVLSMGQLRLVFDFATSLAKTVCISQGDDEGNEGTSFDALMVPTDSEVTVHRCAGSVTPGLEFNMAACMLIFGLAQSSSLCRYIDVYHDYFLSLSFSPAHLNTVRWKSVAIRPEGQRITLLKVARTSTV